LGFISISSSIFLLLCIAKGVGEHRLNISILILAAGESRRFGKTKQLFLLGEQTILQKTIDNYTGSIANEVLVVLGHESTKIRNSIKDRPIITIENPNYDQGMSTSIIAGLDSINPSAQGIVLAMADQPFVDTQTINQLIELFKSNNKGIVTPVYHGKRGNPVIFDIKYKIELLKLKGDIGGRDIVKNHPDDVLEVPVNCAGILLDIDTEENYNQII
jgi:molybdenum cofactor cytidylyltransferase